MEMVEIGGRLFSIHSVNSDRELVFRTLTDHYFEIELKGSALAAVSTVWEYEHVKSLNIFFQELASFRTPWQGIQSWASLDLELSLDVKCTPLGQVIFLVKLYHLTGSLEDWQIEAGLVTELGQLENIARDSNIFFRKEAPTDE